ncbi:MAG TPA: hypothetical protein VGD68_14910 [Streptosporangiaceae bacterium]
MDPNAKRSQGRDLRASVYWQRRLFTLLAGLGVVGLLAWAGAGVISGGSPAAGSGRPSSAAYSSARATPASSVSSSASPGASPSASSSPAASATPAASPSPSRRAVQAKPAHQAAAGPTACPAADLVLTLTASQASYGSSAKPSFRADIVSTDAAPCTLDTGAAALRLVVMHGTSVAYNSASCLHGAQKHVISLHRGVPVVTPMVWDKHETAPGCPATVLAATNRTYAAMAQAGGAQSPRLSFQLTGTPATAAATTRSR